MSDKNSSLINLPDLPDSIDTAVKNLTDKPTQGVGQTLADMWYIPGISMSVASSCISSLNHLGLVYIDSQATLDSQEAYKPYEETRLYKLISSEAEASSSHRKASLTKYSGRLTPLGLNFLEVCVE